MFFLAYRETSKIFIFTHFLTKDKCCRTHDYCTHWIGSFERKWSLFNWNIYTIMDCKCDKRYTTTQLLFSLRKVLFAELSYDVDFWLLFFSLCLFNGDVKNSYESFFWCHILCVNYFLHPLTKRFTKHVKNHSKSLFSLSDV